MDHERVVRIGFLHSPVMGSGYFISDRLIMTALHCVRAAGAGDTCFVQPMLQPGALLQVEEAWADAELDVAVLRLTDGRAFDRLAPDPVPFGRLPTRTRDECRIVGRGYPMGQILEERQGDYEISGRLVWNFAFDLFDLQLTAPVPRYHGPEGRVIEWGGLSGASVLGNDLLLGVVRSFPASFDGELLRVVPAERLLANPGFAALAGIDRIIDWEHGRDLAEAVTPLLSFMDRSRQVTAVENAVKRQIGSRKGQPQRFLIAGGVEDEHHRFIERLTGSEPLQGLLGEANPTEMIVGMDWPRASDIDPQAEWANQLDALAQQLDIPPGEPVTPQRVRSALDGQPRGRAFWWLVQTSKAGRGHGGLAGLWFEFWQRVEAVGDGAPLLVFLCIVADGEPQPGRRGMFAAVSGPDPTPFLDVLREAEDLGAVWLDDLTPIQRMIDLPRWVRELIRRCPQIKPQRLQVVGARIDGRIRDPEVSMKQFCDHATHILQADQRQDTR